MKRRLPGNINKDKWSRTLVGWYNKKNIIVVILSDSKPDFRESGFELR